MPILIKFTTTGQETTFTVSGDVGDLIVDWGSGPRALVQGDDTGTPAVDFEVVASGTNHSISYFRFDYHKQTIKTVTLCELFNTVTDLGGFCNSQKYLTEFNDNANGYGASSVTNFSAACVGCLSLISFTLIDTSNGTNFASAFGNCSSLASSSKINTSSRTNFASALCNCLSLTSFTQLDTSSGTNFRSEWQSCSSLTSFPKPNLSNDIYFDGMFALCSSLVYLPNLNTNSGNNFTYMFNGCTSLKCVKSIDTHLLSDGTGMFDNTPNLCRPNINEQDFIANGEVGINWVSDVPYG